MSSCTRGSDAVCSHASRRAAAGRYSLRLSMCARRCAPNAHASLRICLPAHAARTLYVVTPRTRVRPVDICCGSACASGALRQTPTLRSAYVFLHTRLGRCTAVTPRALPRAGRLARFAPARGRSITTPPQHVRPALRADRPRFAALLSSCAQGSALLIIFASACQIGVVALSSIAQPVDNTSSRYADTSAAHFFRHSSLRFCLPARWISASAFAPFATPRCADISPVEAARALYFKPWRTQI